VPRERCDSRSRLLPSVSFPDSGSKPAWQADIYYNYSLTHHGEEMVIMANPTIHDNTKPDHDRDKDIHKRSKDNPQPDYQKDHPSDAPESGDKQL
jgi:hypothetical protein